MLPTPGRPKLLFRFSLATFLFISLCIGGMIAGYQSGFQSGYRSGRNAQYNDSQAVETYSYASLVWPDLPAEVQLESVGNLTDLIRTTISPEIWDLPNNEIRNFSANRSIVISAPGSVHQEIRQLFMQLDDLANRKLASELQLVPALQALAAKGQTGAMAFPLAVPRSSQQAQQWLEKNFRIAADEISKQWGRPRFDGACTDKAFPQWSLDQKLVTWRRGNGLAYIALRFQDDGKLHLMAGFKGDT
jgi:hypothetical protein